MGHLSLKIQKYVFWSKMHHLDQKSINGSSSLKNAISVEIAKAGHLGQYLAIQVEKSNKCCLRHFQLELLITYSVKCDSYILMFS